MTCGVYQAPMCTAPADATTGDQNPATGCCNCSSTTNMGGNVNCVYGPKGPALYTPSTCQKACMRYEFFALADGGATCRCGNMNGHVTTRTPINMTALKAKPSKEGLNWKFDGCYHDDTSSRAFAIQVEPNDNSITEAQCAFYCSTKGYAYFGRQWENNCWCSNSYDTATKYGTVSL